MLNPIRTASPVARGRVQASAHISTTADIFCNRLHRLGAVQSHNDALPTVKIMQLHTGKKQCNNNNNNNNKQKTLVRTCTKISRNRPGRQRNHTVESTSSNCTTCFGWYFHPSSGAHTTLSTASGICHAVTAICRYRGRVGTGLSVLWVAYATHSTLKPVSIYYII